MSEVNINNKYINFAIFFFYDFFLAKIPLFIGVKIRNNYLKNHFHYLGKNSTISTNVHLISPQKISIQDNVGIARDVVLDGRGSLSIGENSLIGFETIIITSSHNYSRTDILIKDQGMISAPITIGNNTWIGARVTILPGVTIGNNSIIGANSVVTKNIPDDVIAAGVPCKIIKKRA
jgi:maltose O-acetyltransferase